MKNNLGLGVMINMLGGNQDTVDAYNSAMNKEISEVNLSDDVLVIKFKDGTGIKVWDGGQCCCENRYMRTDDDLGYFVGSTLLGIDVKDAPSIDNEWGDHEIQFLEVKTSKGVFTMSSHNEHNGYYGGFYVRIESIK